MSKETKLLHPTPNLLSKWAIVPQKEITREMISEMLVACTKEISRMMFGYDNAPSVIIEVEEFAHWVYVRCKVVKSEWIALNSHYDSLSELVRQAQNRGKYNRVSEVHLNNFCVEDPSNQIEGATRS